MNSEQPLVSIIIPTFNRAHLIGETLDSVLVQTYPHWECIVVDDGSTDHTAEVVGAYLKKDPRFQYHHRPANRPKGANACRNYGFEKSKGEYVQWLDSDDLISREKLNSQLKLTSKNGDNLITCNWRFIKNEVLDYNDRVMRFDRIDYPLEIIKYLFKNQGYFPIHSYLMSRKIVQKAGLWNEALKINQDSEFMFRVILYTQTLVFCDKSKVFYKVNSDDRVSKINEKNIDHYIYSWKLIDLYLKIWFDNLVVIEFEDYKKNILNRIPGNYTAEILKKEAFFFRHLKSKRNIFHYFNKLFSRIFSFKSS